MASVQCLVPSGDLPIDFKWLFNSKPLISVDGISTAKMGKRRSVLTIESVNGRQAGNYTCQAENKAKHVNFTAELVVNGNGEGLDNEFTYYIVYVNGIYYFFLLSY